jgi:hypothetical protein
LKTAIETILNDKELENKMALKSKEIINNEFQYSNMINSFNECIKKVKK